MIYYRAFVLFLMSVISDLLSEGKFSILMLVRSGTNVNVEKKKTVVWFKIAFRKQLQFVFQ